MTNSQTEIRDVLETMVDVDRETTEMKPEEAQKLADLIKRYE